MEKNGTIARIWGIIEKLIMVAVIGIASWMFYTIDGLQDRVTRIEINKQENAAQWRSLKEQKDALEEQEIEVEVMKRVFEMLLDQNRIEINRVSMPKLPPSEKRTVQDFKMEQMKRLKEK